MPELTDNQEIEAAELAIRDRLYQTVTLELANGDKVVYMGRPRLDQTDRVVGVTVSPARSLPDGMNWEMMPHAQGDHNAHSGS